MNVGIYAIINKYNGKYYIGMSSKLNKRETFHFWSLKNNRHVNRHLQRAFNLYGEESFVFEVLEYCKVKELKEKEVHYINFFDAMNNGYNLTLGGEGTLGYQFTDEQKLKIGKSNTGKKRTEEQKVLMSEVSKKNWLKKGYKENHIKRMTGNKINVGRVLSQKRKDEISRQHTGRITKEETKELLRERFKGEGSMSVKLTERDVIDIRIRVLNGEMQTIVAKDYPMITKQTVNDIHRGRRWKHIPNTLEELEKLK